MTIIRKVVFITFSIGAFVYLVLQTEQGQLWLSNTKQTMLEGPISAEPLISKEAFSKMLGNSEQAKQIRYLQHQLDETKAQLSELSLILAKVERESVSSKEQRIEQIPELDEKVLDKDKNVSEMPIQNDIVSQLVYAAKEEKIDASKRQLEQQARLQDIVRRMELTALQAISR